MFTVFEQWYDIDPQFGAANDNHETYIHWLRENHHPTTLFANQTKPNQMASNKWTTMKTIFQQNDHPLNAALNATFLQHSQNKTGEFMKMEETVTYIHRKLTALWYHSIWNSLIQIYQIDAKRNATKCQMRHFFSPNRRFNEQKPNKNMEFYRRSSIRIQQFIEFDPNDDNIVLPF